MTRVVIHQPDFAPYLGFFHRFLAADLYVVLDHAQFVQNTSRAWTHRDKIKTPQGERWLSLSVEKALLGTPIKEVTLSRTRDWRQDNLRLIEENYRKAKHFDEVFPEIERLYEQPIERLADFNLSFIAWMMDAFDVRIPWLLSSSLEPVGQRNEMLVDILRKVDARTYLSGVGARAYLEEDVLKSAGIEVLWQDFRHPVYPQLHGAFVPGLSGLDMLLNCGLPGSRRILRGEQ